MAHAGGRPPKYKTPEEMEAVGQAYFAQMREDGKPITVTGLCLALGFTSRLALINYQGKPEFVNTVKTLKLMCERFAEDQMYLARNPAGPIFALKNFDWSDRQEIKIEGTVNLVSKLASARKRAFGGK